MLSQSNVCHIKAAVSVEELAVDIARRGLLQGLNVRPMLDGEGVETGMFEIPAGGRRFQAFSLLVKQKRLAKTAPIPCIVRDGASEILAEDDSLAENMQRVALHPLDQFSAFHSLREKGQGEEAVAAAFFVTPQIVKQRLKLASVAPTLLEAYEAVAGVVLRDLFQGDDGGRLEDPALLDRLVADKLQTEAEALVAEGWKWIEVATDLPYGYSHGLRRLAGDPTPMTNDESASHAALLAENRALEEEYSGQDEYPEEIDARHGQLKMAIKALEQRPLN